MQEVIDTLAQNQEHTIFLFGGGQKEKEQLQNLVGDKKNVINMAGKILSRRIGFDKQPRRDVIYGFG